MGYTKTLMLSEMFPFYASWVFSHAAYGWTGMRCLRNIRQYKKFQTIEDCGYSHVKGEINIQLACIQVLPLTSKRRINMLGIRAMNIKMA
jgi:hypothetical protein